MHIFTLAHIPVNLQLLASLYQSDRTLFQDSDETTNVVVKLSLERLYTTLIHQFFVSYFQRENISNPFEQKKLVVSLTAAISNIAYDGMMSNRLILSNETLWERTKPHMDVLKEGILDLFKFGVMKPLNETDKFLFNQEAFFIHLTFQEFYAAQYFLSHFDSLRSWMKENKYHPRYRMLLLFLCGLFNQKYDDKDEVIRHFFEPLSEPPRELGDMVHSFLV
eukprot:PhF_6_TR25696/c3_g1_i1/m.36218